MKTPYWFEDMTVLGALPDRELIERLRTLGEDAIADEFEFALASSPQGPSHMFSSEGRWVRERHFWSHTSHVIGYVPLTGSAQKLAGIQPAEKIEADRTLIGQRVNLGLDGFQPQDYPGGEEDPEGKVYRVLFHFAVRHFPGEPEPLHFNISRRIKQRQAFRYLDQPLFVGLTVGEPGLGLRFLTLPLTDPCNAGFFDALASEVARRGMKLSTEPQPAAALASDMAFRTTDKVRREMDPVEDLHLGLGFSTDKRAAPLRTGTYVIAQVPASEQILWEDGGWEDWFLHQPTGKIVHRDDRRQLFPFNYLLLTVDPFAPPSQIPQETRAFGRPQAFSGARAKDSRVTEDSPSIEPTRASPCGGQEERATGGDADLSIHVEIESSPSETRLIYRLYSKVKSLRRHARIEGPRFNMPLEQFHENLLEEMEGLARGRRGAHEILSEEAIADRLVTLGRSLYSRLFQGEMHRQYRLFRDQVCSIQIVSQEPWIPWELLKPYDDSEATLIDDDFFCSRFELTRWLFADRDPADEIRVDKLAAVHAGRVPGLVHLKKADDEYALVTGLAATRPKIADRSLGAADARARELKALLEEGGLGLLHVVAHGDFERKNPDHSGIMMTDKRRFLSSDVSGPIKTQIGKSRPLVFLNACLVGQQAFSLIGLAGWAQAFVGAGCGAFIGPQWSIDDNLAFEFAEAFYGELENGKTFGQAARTARLAVRDSEASSLAWLAPVVYAHPNGRLSFPE